MVCKGQIFNNYRCLCEYMGWKITSGESKIAQLKELATICEYHKQGNKIIIDEVYSEKLKKIDNRVNNKGNGKQSIYYQEFKLIMLSFIKKTTYGVLEFTVTQLMEMMGMISQEYLKYKYSNKILSEEMNISIEVIQQFYEVHQRLLSKGARNCLNKLKKENLINVIEITMVRVKEALPKGNSDNKLGRSYVYREATDKEIEVICNEKRRLIESMECDNMNEVYNKKLNLQFYIRLRNVLEEKYGISFYYTMYRIEVNEALAKEYEEIIKIVDINDLIHSINCKSLKKSLCDYKPKVMKRIEPIEGFNNFEFEIERLSNILISI